MAAPQKILVVDDNAAFTDLVEMVFGGDLKVLKAADGVEGWRLARKGKPDRILLDLMMPKVSGSVMLRGLQADMDTRAIPVLILTASQFDPSTQGLFQQEPNFRAFLRKPCGIETLKTQIAQALKK